MRSERGAAEVFGVHRRPIDDRQRGCVVTGLNQLAGRRRCLRRPGPACAARRRRVVPARASRGPRAHARRGLPVWHGAPLRSRKPSSRSVRDANSRAALKLSVLVRQQLACRLGTRADQLRAGGLRERCEVLRMLSAHTVRVFGSEALRRVAPHGLEHAKARRAPRPVLTLEQAAVEQCCERLEGCGADSFGCSSVQPPAKTARRAKSRCSAGLEQVVAPVDRRAQRPLALGQVAGAAVRSSSRLPGGAASAGGESSLVRAAASSSRQRQPVEARGRSAPRGRVSRVESKSARRRVRARRRARPRRSARRRGVSRRPWHGQRRDRVLVLAGEPQRARLVTRIRSAGPRRAGRARARARRAPARSCRARAGRRVGAARRRARRSCARPEPGEAVAPLRSRRGTCRASRVRRGRRRRRRPRSRKRARRPPRSRCVSSRLRPGRSA